MIKFHMSEFPFPYNNYVHNWRMLFPLNYLKLDMTYIISTCNKLAFIDIILHL